MSDSIDVLKRLALLIRNATMDGENTAERVGRTLVGIIEHLNDVSLDELYNIFLRKDKEDATNYLIKFLGGLISDNIESQSFSSGPFGTGFVVKRDAKTGKSYIETDELYVRLKAYFETLEIKHLSHVGGRIVASPAGMECVKVELVSAEYESLYDSEGSLITDSEGEEVLVPTIGGEQAYRCYFKQTDGEREIVNEFAVDDLAQCREFNVKEGVSHEVSNQYYWRRVIGVGEDYIDLSITDCDPGSMEPKAGDTIVTIGNKTDTARQHVVFLSSYDNDAPCIKLYSGINTYSMLGKEVTVISPNADKNVFTGKVVIKPGSTGYENLADAPDMTEINQEIQNAKDDAASASQAALEVQQSVSDLTSYIGGAFSDGIISESEAKAIATYINIVNNEKKSAEATYNELYNNSYLEGSAKVGLANAKEIMLRHSGDIKYVLRRRHGARFLINLPKYSKLKDVLTPAELRFLYSFMFLLFFPFVVVFAFINLFITSAWIIRDNRVIARSKKRVKPKSRLAGKKTKANK